MQPEIFKVRHKIIVRYSVDRYQTDHATHILLMKPLRDRDACGNPCSCLNNDIDA